MEDHSQVGSRMRGSIVWWSRILDQISEVLLHAPWLQDLREFKLATIDVGRRSLCEPGATEAHIAALESRLGFLLCPSYRALLQASNGFPRFGQLVGRLLSSAEVDWFRNRNPRLAHDIDEWLRVGNPLKPLYPDFDNADWREDIPLRSIEITEADEICTVLLHPEGADKEGEWPVYLRMTGHRRYATLADYAESALEELRTPPTSAFGPIVG